MNKKILSLAVAAVVAAPFAAPISAQAADVSVNGAYSMGLFNTDENLTSATYGTTGGKTGGGIAGSDFGTSKIEFNVKSGDAFAKIATSINSLTGGLETSGGPVREVMAGVKVGGVSIAIGRQANDYNKGVKVDTMTATFLEARKHPGGVAKVSSFVGGLLGVSGKAGDISYGVQYGPADVDMGGAGQNGVYGHVNFKAGPVALGVGFQNDNAGNSTTGVSGKMKFGDIALGVSVESADGAYVGGGSAGTASSLVFADVSMPMGGGTIGLGLGSNTSQSTTFTRVSYDMMVGGGAKLFLGVAKDANNQRAGAGLTVAF